MAQGPRPVEPMSMPFQSPLEDELTTLFSHFTCEGEARAINRSTLSNYRSNPLVRPKAEPNMSQLSGFPHYPATLHSRRKNAAKRRFFGLSLYYKSGTYVCMFVNLSDSKLRTTVPIELKFGRPLLPVFLIDSCVHILC